MHASSLLRYARDALVFAPCYIALDWASYIAPLGPFNITPWNPQPALGIVWMQLAGLSQAPAVFLAIAVADVVVRHAPAGYAVTLLTAFVLASCYAGLAWLLRSVLRLGTSLHSTRELALFAGTIFAGTAVVGLAFVGMLVVTGGLSADVFAAAALKFWIGDAVGVLVTAPLLLAVADAAHRKALATLLRRPETWLQLAVLAATLWLIFGGLSSEPARYFYLLFLPLIWIAVRSGLNGAVIATLTVQLGVVIGIHQDRAVQIAVLELQALVAALTLTGLFLGMMVDERERATDALRHSLRLAAAGEMAGAIAHEINQPLTALANYGQSARTLLARGAGALEQLPAVIEKMLRESERAAEVVRRLRDFFRAGTTRLEPVSIENLLAAARAIGRQLIGSRTITLDVHGDADLPAIFADRLQIELVLRNLIANAVDSLEAQPNPDKRISVRARRGESDSVHVVVADNGPGLAPGIWERLFEPFASGRASGMGLGLAISRAIAEAHGGSLAAVGTSHCEFHLTLPTEPAHERS